MKNRTAIGTNAFKEQKQQTSMTHALLECTYCNGWAVLAHATIQDDVEVVIGWIQEPADDAENWKGLQIHTKNRQLGETYENIYIIWE